MRTIFNKTTVKESLPARTNGYYFAITDDIWILDGNHQINTKAVTDILDNNLKDGYLNTIAYFARNFSASFSCNLHGIFLKFIRSEKCSVINKSAVLNFKMKMDRTGGDLRCFRLFIVKWHSLGYSGIEQDAIQIMQIWRFNRPNLGEIVKRRDPKQGPLTDIEVQSFNDSVIRAYEKKDISLLMLTMALLVSHTGRRPVQLLQMKIRDIMMISKENNDIYYLVNIPRIKQGLDFREEFRTFRITKELYKLVCKQANESIILLSIFMGRDLTAEEIKDVPFFISTVKFRLIDKRLSLSDYLKSDKLHYYRGKINKVLKSIIGKEKIYSERTGELLNINARRFRYTLGTRAAKEGYGEIIIAELLDHSTTDNVGIYVQNNVDNAYKIDKAVGKALVGISDAFKGQVKRREDVGYEITPLVKIKSHDGEDAGSCQQCSSCSANVPIPCYTCMHFTPWLNGPHEKIYQYLISERERIHNITQDRNVTESLDRIIIAVGQVINHCKAMRDLEQGRENR
ncbi:tyrosine-type recombinase/integrase [Escherichia coli]|nr:tyrosine-type recombinase/integrase [Escherichia coli]